MTEQTLSQAQEKAVSYVKKAIEGIDELDVDLPEELVSDFVVAQRKWIRVHERSIDLIESYEGSAATGADLIYDLFRSQPHGECVKDALMLVHDRIEAGEY
jgi:hypothetical protein